MSIRIIPRPLKRSMGSLSVWVPCNTPEVHCATFISGASLKRNAVSKWPSGGRIRSTLQDTCAIMRTFGHGPLARYVKFRVAHAPGMPGTFSPPPRVSDPDMHHGTCVTHVPWCMPGSLTSVSFDVRGGENVPGIPSACANRNFTYLVNGPWRV